MQGRCIVRNSVQSKLARSIAIDYFSGYLVNEYGRQALFELPAYGGANCAVRATTLRRLGGWNTESVTEDTDLTLRVVMLGDRVRYDITAVDTEEGATTLRRFISQRYRWARGHQQVWRDYRGYVLRTPAPERAREARDDAVPARLPRAGAVHDDAADDGAAHRRHRPDGDALRAAAAWPRCCSPARSASSPSV